MRCVFTSVVLVAMLFLLTACSGTQSTVTPTSTPSPMLPGSVTPEPASETYRLDLGPGLVAAFVEGLTPEMPEKVAYVTHVPSGTQAILNREGHVIHRHEGRADGPSPLGCTPR